MEAPNSNISENRSAGDVYVSHAICANALFQGLSARTYTLHAEWTKSLCTEPGPMDQVGQTLTVAECRATYSWKHWYATMLITPPANNAFVCAPSKCLSVFPDTKCRNPLIQNRTCSARNSELHARSHRHACTHCPVLFQLICGQVAALHGKEQRGSCTRVPIGTLLPFLAPEVRSTHSINKRRSSREANNGCMVNRTITDKSSLRTGSAHLQLVRRTRRMKNQT